MNPFWMLVGYIIGWVVGIPFAFGVWRLGEIVVERINDRRNAKRR